MLTGGGDKKINVIKEVRSIRPDLGLKEAKDLVEGAPQNVKENVSKQEAEDIKKQARSRRRERHRQVSVRRRPAADLSRKPRERPSGIRLARPGPTPGLFASSGAPIALAKPRFPGLVEATQKDRADSPFSYPRRAPKYAFLSNPRR